MEESVDDAVFGARHSPELGIECVEGWNARNLDTNPDLVVVGNVCRRDNPEAQEAKTRKQRPMLVKPRMQPGQMQGESTRGL